MSHDERLFVGVDVAKNTHKVAFVSSALLRQRKRPVFSVTNSRAGFEKLIALMKRHAPLKECAVLMEKTGHYGHALLQYLQQHGVAVYVIHAQKRMARDKSDELDARHLANMLYNQVGLGATATNKEEAVHPVVQMPETAQRLSGLTRHRYELGREACRRENQIIAYVDEYFPEFTEVIKDPCCQTALNILERFPRPADIASASFDEIRACRSWRKPGNAKLRELQELAAQTIGVSDPLRSEAAMFELARLIEQLRMLKKHEEDLDAKIAAIVKESREGKILLSTGIMSTTQAGTILACIGNIERFEKPGWLKAFAGWCPVRSQTGTSRDSVKLTKGGNRMLKNTMYFIGMHAISEDTEWRDLYRRLLKKHCIYDAKTGDYRGKIKVMARVISQIIGLIWRLLKSDHEKLRAVAAGDTEPPPPTLYDRNVHRGHRNRRIP